VTGLPILPTASSPIDRDYLQRENPELFDELWQNPLTRVLPVHNGKVLLEDVADHPTARLRLLPVEGVPSAQLRVYLGKTLLSEGDIAVSSPIVLAVVSDNSAAEIEPDAKSWRDLRRAGLGLSELHVAIYTQAIALANFHRSHVHCTLCGSPTVIQQGGWSRRCFKDEKQVFPRTDPAIIVAVTDSQERILLGSQGVWEANRWSILAGFVEAGESLNAAVAREVEEEAGVRVDEIHFLGSQAWPFPNSLMVGFHATLDESGPEQLARPDGIEIAKVAWFTRAEVAEGYRTGSLILPGPISIARAIIEHWFGGPLDV
jgi:NAD+ diphosphatase